MVEKEVIIRRLTCLEEYFRDLEEIKQSLTWEEFQTNKITRRFVERTLHMLIEACIDIANHIISYEGYREPMSNKDTFQVLAEEKILDKKLAERLKKMAQFRNVIVHDYVRIKPEIVYTVLQSHLNDILEFAKLVKRQFL